MAGKRLIYGCTCTLFKDVFRLNVKLILGGTIAYNVIVKTQADMKKWVSLDGEKLRHRCVNMS